MLYAHPDLGRRGHRAACRAALIMEVAPCPVFAEIVVRKLLVNGLQASVQCGSTHDALLSRADPIGWSNGDDARHDSAQ
jgi:hypothetical protein